MAAIIETGGKQYIVKTGDKIFVEKLPGNIGDSIKFDKVLYTSQASNINVGKPLVPGAVVEARIVKQGRGDKIHVFKYKAKSRYRRKQGHRQFFTEVEITKI